MYCPSCGEKPLTDYINNKPVADFYCGLCSEDFELKSTKGKFGKKITDGAYATMMTRLQSDSVPSLMLLRYTAANKMVQDLSVIPKQFFVTDLIEERKPLSQVEQIGQAEFTLDDVYKFENYLSEMHPDNNHVKPKIRQQLQKLRDAGILEFIARGRYRVV